VSHTDRQRRWRARKAGTLDPVLRCACGASIFSRGQSPHRGTGLCRDCWRASPDGKEWERARRSSRRYELLPRGDQLVLCQVRPWRELFTYDDASQALIDFSLLSDEPSPTVGGDDRHPGADPTCPG
jgi:hypothetical protein